MSETEKEKEQQFLRLMERVVEEKMDKYFARLSKSQITEVSNENGTASILKSGNSIVYIDNSGIAYAMLLFFYHTMSDKEKEAIKVEGILRNIEEKMANNRMKFEELINSLKEQD
jgi:hypothetical protein